MDNINLRNMCLKASNNHNTNADRKQKVLLKPVKASCHYLRCTSLRAALLPISCLLLLAALTSCVPAVVAGGAATANVLAQERTVGNAIDDMTLEAKINALYFDKDVDLFSDVDVDVIERRVLLTGSVNSVEAAIEAVNLAWQVDGVQEVINELQIKSSDANIRDLAQDMWIRAQINGKLMFTKGVGYANYTIEVVNGVVYLMGIASNKEEIKRVAELASKVPHVKKVISHLILKDDPRRLPYDG